MENENSGCGKITAVLGIVASIIAVFTFLTGIVSIKDFAGANNPQSTDYYQQVSTIAPPITDIPQSMPTSTFEPTLIPTETTLPDTILGTILEVGQSWRQDGLELTLVDATLSDGNSYYGVGTGFETCFILTNLRSYDFTLRYTTENISAQDNFGNRLNVLSCQHGCDKWNEVTRTIRSGESVVFGLDRWTITQSDFACLYVEADTANPNITEIIITISNVAAFSEARWRIDVHH